MAYRVPQRVPRIGILLTHAMTNAHAAGWLFEIDTFRSGARCWREQWRALYDEREGFVSEARVKVG